MPESEIARSETEDCLALGKEEVAHARTSGRGAIPAVSQSVAPAKRTGYRAFKRASDIVLSLVASIILLIPALVLIVMIEIKDPGNPFYKQERVGRGGRTIGVLKFRTMVKNADDLEKTLSPEQLEEYRREYKLKDDPRLLGWKKPGDGAKCFGTQLRRLSLDEVMQIPYNVLIKGDMSLVGPRPILEEELVRHYTSEEQELLLSVKPGLTGYWQAYARNDVGYEDGKRQQMELYYVRNCSVRLDAKIIFATFGSIIKKNGV